MNIRTDAYEASPSGKSTDLLVADPIGADIPGTIQEVLGFEIPAALKPDTDPQTLPQGVAAGDVTEDSVVLWARSLALGDVTFTVYEVRENGRLKKVAKETVEVTDTDVPVKILIDGLDAGKDHVYAVEDAAGAEKTGRFTTAQEAGYHGLTFGVSGDWRGDLAPYQAVANADEADLDFFLLGGDTIYADFTTPAFPQTLELEGFRIKYQEVYGSRGGENFFADLRASTAVYATIDDHELFNDFAGGAPASAYIPTLTGLVNDSDPYEEGLQAFQEYHPIADVFYDDTGDDRTANERVLYRSQSFGQDAAVIMLDGRSFRDFQIDSATAGTPAEIAQFQIESFDPTRTMLGAQQLADLKQDLLHAQDAGATWKFVFTPVPIQDLGINSGDSWEGYKAERTEILSFIDANDISNVVFIAGDLHGTVVNNLTYSTTPLGEQIATSAFEITTGSVAFDAPFGPSVVEAVSGTPLLPPEQEAFYNSLPIAPDADGLLNDKDDFIREFFNQITLDPLGLDRLGLDDNLLQANGLIDVELLQGGWVSTHTYGWTQFDIDPETQALTVTTWGIDYYTEEQLLADPSSILELEPRIVSQFVVYPDTGADTEVPAMLEPLAGFEVAVAFTIGDTFSGTRGTFNASTAGDYTPVGVLDGLGAHALDMDGDGANDVVRLFANHELLHFAGSEYELSDGAGGSYSLTGARISYFDFDIETRQIIDAGIAYDTIVAADGETATDASFQPDFLSGLSRFCSSVLVEAEAFGKNRGLKDTIYFAGEEDVGFFNPVGGAEWALDVETGTLYQIPAMGRGAWENVTPIDTGDSTHVAFILSDDSAPFDVDSDGKNEAAPLFLYVGEKDKHSEDFLARNGLDDGKLYVWVAESEQLSAADAIKAHIAQKLSYDALGRWEERLLEVMGKLVDRFADREELLEKIANAFHISLDGAAIDSPLEFNGTANAIDGRWVDLDNSTRPELASEDGATGYDEYGYPTQGNLWLQAEALGAFGFSRPEDVATNPENGSEFVLASTGVDTYDVDPATGNGVDTFGTIYTMEIDFRNGVPKSSELKILYDGDDDLTRALRSPDNLDWADDGRIYVQEDKTGIGTLSGDEFLFGDGAVNPNEAGIVAIDPASGEVVRIANINRDAVLDGSLADPTAAVDLDAAEAGAWESSGILDVSALFGEEGGTLFLTTVQAHGIEDQPDPSRITDGDLVEGGQLLFLAADNILG